MASFCSVRASILSSASLNQRGSLAVHRVHQVQVDRGVAADVRLDRQYVEHVRELGDRLLLEEVRLVRQHAEQLHRQLVRKLAHKALIRRVREAEARLQQRRPGRGVPVQELGRQLRQRAVRREQRQVCIHIGRLAGRAVVVEVGQHVDHALARVVDGQKALPLDLLLVQAEVEEDAQVPQGDVELAAHHQRRGGELHLHVHIGLQEVPSEELPLPPADRQVQVPLKGGDAHRVPRLVERKAQDRADLVLGKVEVRLVDQRGHIGLLQGPKALLGRAGLVLHGQQGVIAVLGRVVAAHVLPKGDVGAGGLVFPLRQGRAAGQEQAQRERQCEPFSLPSAHVHTSSLPVSCAAGSAPATMPGRPP